MSANAVDAFTPTAPSTRVPRTMSRERRGGRQRAASDHPVIMQEILIQQEAFQEEVLRRFDMVMQRLDEMDAHLENSVYPKPAEPEVQARARASAMSLSALAFRLDDGGDDAVVKTSDIVPWPDRIIRNTSDSCINGKAVSGTGGVSNDEEVNELEKSFSLGEPLLEKHVPELKVYGASPESTVPTDTATDPRCDRSPRTLCFDETVLQRVITFTIDEEDFSAVIVSHRSSNVDRIFGTNYELDYLEGSTEREWVKLDLSRNSLSDRHGHLDIPFQILSEEGEIFEGQWCKGFIKHDTLTWNDGGVDRLVFIGNTKLRLMISGKPYEGVFLNGAIHWDDGDVWNREPPKAETQTSSNGECPSEAPQKFSDTVFMV